MIFYKNSLKVTHVLSWHFCQFFLNGGGGGGGMGGGGGGVPVNVSECNGNHILLQMYFGYIIFSFVEMVFQSNP